MNNANMPAMPTNNPHYDGNWNKEQMIGYGLTKREHFAGLAMQATLSNPEFSSSSPEAIASVAVEQADALLAELQATESGK